MKPRLNSHRAAPKAMRALAALDTYVGQSGIEPSLIELVKTSRLADQRLRLLPAHAYPRCAC